MNLKRHVVMIGVLAVMAFFASPTLSSADGVPVPTINHSVGTGTDAMDPCNGCWWWCWGCWQ